MSVALLVISLLITNTDYRGRALQMRKNYLDLQHFYNSLLLQNTLSDPTKEMIDQYAEFLYDIENHLSVDDKYWRAMAPQTAKLSRPASEKEICDVKSYIFIRNFYFFTLYTLPLIIGFCLFYSK